MMDTLTIFLAIWGAVTGTIATIVSVILAVREFGKDSYQIRIKDNISGNDPFWLTSDSKSESYVVSSILNIGFRPVQIQSVYLTSDRGKYWRCDGRMEKADFPKTLAEGDSIKVYFAVSIIRDELRQIRNPRLKLVLYIEDGKGKKHKHFIDEIVTGEIIRLG
jgi:hypothetical protein